MKKIFLIIVIVALMAKLFTSCNYEWVEVPPNTETAVILEKYYIGGTDGRTAVAYTGKGLGVGYVAGTNDEYWFDVRVISSGKVFDFKTTLQNFHDYSVGDTVEVHFRSNGRKANNIVNEHFTPKPLKVRKNK